MNARELNPPPDGAWMGWFDGSALPNPGRIGIGALLRKPNGEDVEISRRAGEGDSSEAEYLALIALLEAALPFQPPQLLIRGDSQVVINDIILPPARGGQSAKGMEAHRARVMELIATLGGPEVVSLRWVPRHRNPDADRLSQAAVRGPL